MTTNTATCLTLGDALADGVVRDRCTARGLAGYAGIAAMQFGSGDDRRRLAVLADLVEVLQLEAARTSPAAAVRWHHRAKVDDEWSDDVTVIGGSPGLLEEPDKLVEHWAWLHELATDVDVAQALLHLAAGERWIG